MSLESQLKFPSPKNIFGASQQTALQHSKLLKQMGTYLKHK